jgi:hypothetical protein
MTELVKRPRPGQPTKYKEWMCDKIVEVAQKGGLRAARCIAIGVNRDTYLEWCKRYPDFKAASDWADLLCQAFDEEVLRKISLGEIDAKGFNAHAMRMNNAYKHDYSRSPTNNNTEITINQLNISPKERRQLIAQKLEFCSQNGETFNNIIDVEAED